MQVRTLVAQPSEQGRAPAEVTRLAAAPDSPYVAAGHADGSVRIWNLDTGDCEVLSSIHAQCASHAEAVMVSCSSGEGGMRVMSHPCAWRRRPD